MTVDASNSAWQYRDFTVANNGAFRETVTLGTANDTWTLDNAAMFFTVRPAPGHPTLILQLTSAIGYIQLRDAKTRQIQFNAPDYVMAPVPPGAYYYDLVVQANDGFTYRRLVGRFNVHQGIGQI
jgi:hypothetical protein